MSTDVVVATTVAPPSSSLFEALPPSLYLVAQRFVGLALQHDYLSNGRGHLQSHRALAARPMALVAPPRPAAGAARPRVRSFSDAEQQYLARISSQPRLSSAEEYGLARRMRAGDTRARNALIEANLGLVVMFARRHVRPGLPLLDLIAEGNLGLFASADRFDPEMGFRFATYAKWWVLHGIRAAVKRFLLSEGQAVETLAASEPASPEAPEAAEPAGPVQGGRSGAAETSAQAAPSDTEPPHVTLHNQRSALLRRALDGLSPRDRAIVSARFALTENEEQTLAALAQRYALSIERVRQIERAALLKLARTLAHWGVTADALF